MQNGDRRVRAAGVWQSGRVLRGQEVPPTSCLLEVDFVWLRGGSVVPPFWLLWQGAGRVAGGVVGTNQRIYIQGAVGEVFTRRGGARGGWRSVGIMGRAELCGANNKRDTTPEGWLFLKLLDV